MPLSWDFLGKAASNNLHLIHALVAFFFTLGDVRGCRVETENIHVEDLSPWIPILLQITEPEQWDLPAAKKKFIAAKKKLLVYFYGTKEMWVSLLI